MYKILNKCASHVATDDKRFLAPMDFLKSGGELIEDTGDKII